MNKSMRNIFGGLAGCAVLTLAGTAFGETVGFDADWEFALKDFWVSYGKVGMCKPQDNSNDNGTPRVAADTNGWARVTLPHDWALGLDYAEKGTRNGFKAIGKSHPQNNVGWYRKWFAVPKDADGKRVFIRFDGVYRDAQFWVNGIYLGRNDSGYLGRRFEITDFLRFGKADNFVSVRVDASKDEGWWYDGAGIVRHVWLEYKDADGLVPDSVFIRLKELRDGVAVMRVDYECLESGKAGYDFEVKEPRLWSPDDPHLYTLELKGETFTYGIRTVVFDPDRGMLVNGRRVEVRGVCCHQDHAGLGVALPDSIVEYRIRLLKQMGVNAYRTSHNPPSPVLLDICDKYGIVVMDETRLFASSAEGLDQFSRLILRDRNHPSVVAYSVGDEEHNVQSTETGRRMAETMKRVQRALDPTRVITYGGNNGVTHTGINEVTDVRGVNYIRLAKFDEGEFDRYHADHPTTPVWGSEEASTLTTRGAEVFFGFRQVLPDLDIPATRPNGWSYGAEEWTTRAAARPWFAGAFAWTGFDYRGECHWPAINCNFGILDLCGFPKNNAWYYRARWTDGDVLHVYPHANAARTNFWVNTNCDRVELLVNGKSVGTQTRTNGVYRLSFPVDFTRGEVVARGVRKGREIVTRIVTSGRFAKLALEPDRTTLAADGVDATVVNIMALDADGNVVPDCNERLYFVLEGKGEILGVGNGDPLDHDADLATAAGWTRRLFNGRCQVVVRSARKAGSFVLRAQSDTVPSAAAEIKTVEEVRSGPAGVWNVFPEDVRTVGIVSVSDIIGAANLTRATNELTKAGYAVKVMPNVMGPKQVSAAERARYFEEAWLDHSIDLLMFSTGGKGAIDVIDVIDWEKLKTRDMRVIGYSDLTLVLNTMLRKGVGHPFTGPMISTLGALKTSDEARLRMRATLDGNPNETQLKAVRKASVPIVGKPMGGLLDRVWKLAERDLLPSAEGRIVFLENTPKYGDRARQMLDRLIELGVFDKAAAVVFCDFNRNDSAEDVARVFRVFANKVKCPVYSGYPYGHVSDSYLLDFKMNMAITSDDTLVKASDELGPET